MVPTIGSQREGEIIFSDCGALKIPKIGLQGVVSDIAASSRFTEVVAFGPEGRLHSWRYEDSKIISPVANGKVAETVTGFAGGELVVAHHGNVYAIEISSRTNSLGKLWLIGPRGARKSLDTGWHSATAITRSPDQTMLYVADSGLPWIYSFQIQREGSLASKERLYWLHTPNNPEPGS